MQKDENQNNLSQEAESLTATPKTNEENSGGSTEKAEGILVTGEKSGCDADSNEEFERLIKGPYKEAFAKRVQGIINQRFKEKKTAEKNAVTKKIQEGEETLKEKEITQESGKKADKDTDCLNPAFAAREAELVAMGYKDFSLAAELKNPTFKALLEGGVDMLTAYQALHFEEIMEESVKMGAESAAKQMADSIRFKAGRPGENGLTPQMGFGTRRGVSSLTPKARKELARKSLMGEKISF